MKVEAVLSLLAREARPLFQEWAKTGSCILSTRVAVDVCHELGFRAEALSASVVVYNPALAARLARGEPPPQTPEDVLAAWDADRCWSVGIGSGASPDAKVLLRDTRARRWPGHLVALVDETWVLDLALYQFSRPERDIRLEPFFWRVTDAAASPLQLNGCLLYYLPRPEDRSYLDSPDWQTHRPTLTNSLVGTVRPVRRGPLQFPRECHP